MPPSEAAPFHPTHHVGKAAALALHLAEAENALHTFTSGEVDAIIGPSGQAYPALTMIQRNIELQARLLVFNPLQQGDDTIQRQYGRMDLGLLIARGLAEAHHGASPWRVKGTARGRPFG